MKQKGEDTISLGRSVSNNLYAIKLAFSLSPSRVICEGINRFLGYFEWVFYSAFFMRYVIGALESKQSFTHILTFLIVTQVVFAAISIYSNYMNGKVFPITGAVVFKKLYAKLFQKSRSVELACFEDAKFYNRYTLALDKAAENLLNAVSNLFGIVFGAIAAVAAFSVMFGIDPWAMAFVIFPVLGNFLFNNKLSQLVYKRDKEIAPHNRKVEYVNRVIYLSDYAKEVRLTNVFSMLKRKYNEAIDGMVSVAGKYTKLGMFLHWMRVQFTFTLIFEGVLIYGAYRTIVSQTMSLAELAVLSSVMVSSTWILIGFAGSLIESFQLGLFIENLRGFMEYKPKLPENQEGADPGTRIEKIEFRNVSFSYREKEVIHNLSFELREKQSYAMVGHNGAGKSTIIKLLMRLYDPTEGEILLNGRNIKEFNLKKYRALFSTAFQDYQIFSMSVMENVLMERGRPEDEPVVIDALKRAGVYEKVEQLPKGIHTILTHEFDEDGAVLSGGQFQKIGVARAFVQDVSIKVFDEPSSALDPIAEYELFENIIADSAEKTMLFISHRLSSVQNADWVFMLEDGQVIEQGTHEDLMNQDGKYADMYRKQAKDYLATEELSAEDSQIFGKHIKSVLKKGG